MLTDNDIEAELSYAYLHAVASSVGIACQYASRSFDNSGVDAELRLIRDFGAESVLTEINVNVQLKATTTEPKPVNGRIPFFLDNIKRYDQLRSTTATNPCLLVVLFLPSPLNSSVIHSIDELIIRKCGYWVSLRGAADSANSSGKTVYIPESQVMSPNELEQIFRRISVEEELTYVG